MIEKKSNYFEKALKSLESKDSEITIVGLGYVGLPLLVQFYRKGFKCIGLDLNKKKIKDKLIFRVSSQDPAAFSSFSWFPSSHEDY